MMNNFAGKWAVLVGPKDYQYVRPLQYSTADIVEVSRVFREYLNFPQDHILEFGSNLPLQARASEFWHALGSLLNTRAIQADDLLLFYFSGHGIRDSKDYLLPVEASPYNLKRTGIQFEDLVEELTRSDCKNIVMFIDACREPVHGEKGTLSIGEESSKLAGRAGFATIFSCAPDELSYEIDELQHGSFTYCFLEAIKSRTCISLSQMYKYLVTQVPLTNQKYHKWAQKPYPVQAGDKWELPIFASAAQLLESSQRIDRLIAGMQELFATQRLDVRYFKATIAFLDSARSVKLAEDEQEKLTLIEQAVTQAVTLTAFAAIWDGMERRRLLGLPLVNTRPTLGGME